ncbi:MAG TPA: DNA mismatch repair endonuclease MutL [Candidatus Onthenecus intestinigallinarum]|uniref:DNA mismatch repair protein MutL n=1 Tax=Candidatus Onthenecus intestinigallinarum TaxID=2840875 RepID=A0A9D0ZBQ5_9FIRM|nr:DNA mismatch repair endonuclease MutL [Candidatus Onthenecus intestinigallinarum]
MEYRPIRKLDADIVGKIAAGEVVESPAAAIKELVENSIDAGARAVAVEIREGGISYLRVTDNGSGIRREDVRMAFERNATSKITRADDLFDLRSLGFRGEALASIAAVSKVTMTTRTRGDESGTRVINEGGVITSISDAASPEGTTIVARELFYNTPVRRKFLKKPATEGARVADMILRMILAHPEVAIRLTHNDRQIYASPGNGDLRAAALSVYGRDVARQLIDVRGEGGVGVRGLVGVGPLARANRTHQTFILNGRYVRNALLTQALEDACRERVTVGHYPICMLHVSMPGPMLDVNVHPNKLEVRFSSEPVVYDSVFAAVRGGFETGAFAQAPEMTLSNDPEPVASVRVVPAPEHKPEPARSVSPAPRPVPVKPAEGEAAAFARVVTSYFGGPEKRAHTLRNVPGVGAFSAMSARLAPQPVETAPDAQAAPVQPETPPQQQNMAAAPTERPPRVIGVAFDTYVIVQRGQELLLIDQHAAHERILYERLMRSLDQGTGSQQMLVAQVVPVTPQERDRLEQYRAEIEAAGFAFEPFGEDTYQIRAVPVVLGEPQARAAFVEMLDRLGELRVLATRERRREAILQMACKRAVKGGDALTQEEIASLIRQMEETDAPPTCPHGRPLVVRLTRSELEKRFRRINN